MFTFTTTNVINSYQDLTTGLPLFSVQEKTVDGDKTITSLNIKRVNNFVKDNVVAIYKSEGHVGKPAEATVSFAKIASPKKGDIFRLNLYIRLAQSMQSSYYANDTAFKGRPLTVEFTWKGDAAETLKALKRLIEKYEIAVFEKPLIKVSISGTDLVIKAVDEYQRFHKVCVERYDAEAYHGMGEFIPEVVALEASNPDYDDEQGTITQGVEGFGTYSWLLHNLRLPTTMRTRIYAVNSDETPIPGALYNEYVIEYCVNRGVLGNSAVGDMVTSKTTHVFYVNQALLEQTPEGELEDSDNITNSLHTFEDALAMIAPEVGIVTVTPRCLEEKEEDDSKIGG